MPYVNDWSIPASIAGKQLSKAVMRKEMVKLSKNSRKPRYVVAVNYFRGERQYIKESESYYLKRNPYPKDKPYEATRYTRPEQAYEAIKVYEGYGLERNGENWKKDIGVFSFSVVAV